MRTDELRKLKIGPRTNQTVRDTLTAHNEYLQPAFAENILLLVTATLSHFFTRAEDDKVAEVMAEQYLAILGHLPLHAISDGCLSWLSEHSTKRPTPADLLSRASASVRYELEYRAKLELVVDGL